VAELKRRISPDDNDHTGQPSPLHPFVGNLRDKMPKGLPYHLTDYMKLLDWTGNAEAAARQKYDRSGTK
jgi:hypothetical protein